jgi:hypothetical protein
MVKKACGKARGVRESASWQVEITMASRRGIKKMISENVGISKRKESRTHMQLDLFFFLALRQQVFVRAAYVHL